MKTAVIYFSRSGQCCFGGHTTVIDQGNTKRLCEYLAKACKVDTFEITPKDPYPYEYTATLERAKQEWKQAAFPAVDTVSDLTGYDLLVVAGPCWFGTYPRPVFTALKDLHFSGKAVAPLITHEGSGLALAPKDLASIFPDIPVLDGLALKGSEIQDHFVEAVNWLQQLQTDCKDL